MKLVVGGSFLVALEAAAVSAFGLEGWRQLSPSQLCSPQLLWPPEQLVLYCRIAVYLDPAFCVHWRIRFIFGAFIGERCRRFVDNQGNNNGDSQTEHQAHNETR